MSAENYADYLFFNYVVRSDFDEEIGRGWIAEEDVLSFLTSTMRQVFLPYGYNVTSKFDDLVITHLNWMKGNGIFAVDGDQYTGTYLRLITTKKTKILDDLLKEHEIQKRIARLGPVALARALEKLSIEGGWLASADGIQSMDVAIARFDAVPASDRIVNFSDNQSIDMQEGLAQVVNELRSGSNEIGNAIGDDAPLIAVELEAAAVLVRSKSARLAAVMVLLIKPLKFIADKFAGAALGELAKRLIAELLKLMN
ncbi:hypothetical protein [Sphingobium sp. RAC03]|uniref:hypothetical protein n=1 Tax=Sphingobium sp. RAC03 TaxID=1843368 RepID=UPI0012378DAB|nr:hypothetical protein [Sphingobium sp. RAC03]